jgi:acetoin utilization deacetylase AcuC-like enzyme
LRKERSSRDVGVADGLDDRGYLDTLAQHLPEVWEDARPDVVFYLAGVDPAAGDRYGRLSLTPDGIRLRDRFVLEETQRRGIPAVLVLAGGYARTVLETANLHAMVHREAAQIFPSL